MKMTNELIHELANGFEEESEFESWEFHPDPLRDPRKIKGKSRWVVRGAALVWEKTKKAFTPEAISKALSKTGKEMSPDTVRKFLRSLSTRDSTNRTNSGIFLKK